MTLRRLWWKARHVHWRGLMRAVLWTQLLAQAVGLLKIEACVRLTLWIQDPWWLRFAVYGIGIGTTALAAPFNAWLCHRLQQPRAKT